MRCVVSELMLSHIPCLLLIVLKIRRQLVRELQGGEGMVGLARGVRAETACRWLKLVRIETSKGLRNTPARTQDRRLLDDR